MVKPDLETLPTVPDDPPAAGPDRALDPSPTPGVPAERLLDAYCVADAEGDSRSPTESPIIGTKSAVATMLRPFFFVSNRRTLGLRACVAVVTGADQSGRGAGRRGSEPASPELAAPDGPDTALDSEGMKISSGFVWS